MIRRLEPGQTPQEREPRMPEVYYSHAIRQALEEAGVTGEVVAAIGLTGQMHGLVLLDERGRVLRPAILWNDQRTGPQCDEIRARLGRERLIQMIAVLVGAAALVGLLRILPVGLPEAPPLPEGYGGFRQVGIALYTDYVLLVEMASLLLLAAIAGAQILAKRKVD